VLGREMVKVLLRILSVLDINLVGVERSRGRRERGPRGRRSVLGSWMVLASMVVSWWARERVVGMALLVLKKTTIVRGRARVVKRRIVRRLYEREGKKVGDLNFLSLARIHGPWCLSCLPPPLLTCASTEAAQGFSLETRLPPNSRLLCDMIMISSSTLWEKFHLNLARCVRLGGKPSLLLAATGVSL